MSSSDGGDVRIMNSGADGQSGRQPGASADVAETPDGPDRLDAARLAESTAALLDAATKALNRSSEILEESSRWTLLFVAFAFGLLLAVAPTVLIWTRGELAATAPEFLTTPEYLVTSLCGGVLALSGIVGLIVSDRGARNTAVAVQEQSAVLQEQSNVLLAALRDRAKTSSGSPPAVNK